MLRARRWTTILALSVLGLPSAAGAATVDERERLGTTVEDRPIVAFHRGDPEDVAVLVVGCIHGDECAGVRIARRLLRGDPRRFVDCGSCRRSTPTAEPRAPGRTLAAST